MRTALLLCAAASLAGCVPADAADPRTPPSTPAEPPSAPAAALFADAPPGTLPAGVAPVPAGGEGLPDGPALLATEAGLELAFHRDLAGAPGDVYVMHRGAGGWEPPVNVSRSAAPASQPRLAAGPRGELHAVWGERRSNASPRPGAPPTAVYHAVRVNGAWSTPRELFRTPHEGMRLPESLVVDGEGAVHVAFAARELVTRRMTVYHARRGPGGWSAPRAVGAGVDPDLVLGPDGGLHLVFLEGDTVESRGAGRDVNSVFVTRSVDGGAHWSAPVRVSRSGVRPAHRPRLAVAGGELHLVWLQAMNAADIYPDAVVHARSADGHAWTQPVVVSAGVRGLPESLERVVDGGGRLHLAFRVAAGLGRGPYRPYHAVWEGGRWSAPEHLLGLRQASQRIALAAAEGGGVHVVLGAADLGASAGLFHFRRP